MKILLFNDNPVVRKLVALSAQKTKDDLSVIWSVDEVEESGYDLLIVDDALYSDEMFSSLKELVTFNSTLLMATRGKAIPAGFDNVINKPFLPTDLVDMFIQIEKKLSDNPIAPEIVFAETPIEEKPPYAINLEETLPDLGSEDLNTFESFDLEGLDDLTEGSEMEGHLDSDYFEDAISETAILDKEEVQEVQELLDDTDNDDWDWEDEIELSGIDLDDEDKIYERSEAVSRLGDEELGALESQIQNAVNTLEEDTLDREVEPEDFDMQLDDSFLEELKLPDREDDNSFSGADDLDMLDERELKLAIGEEVEDEPEPDADTLSVEPAVEMGHEVTHAEGVEALQALLKALSNEEVAKSLKGLNISININFGNQQ